VQRVEVEVFPIEPARWIAVIDGPSGPFSAEISTPGQVEQETRGAIATVLGLSEVQIDCVDDLGRPWSLDLAAAQASRSITP
jgi:hypothetical protein